MVLIYNLAYVKFRVDGETAAINISVIKNFDRESHHEDKCYMVQQSSADVMANSARISESNSNSKKNKKGRPTCTTFFRSRPKQSKRDENSSDDDSIGVETDEYYRAQILLFGGK